MEEIKLVTSVRRRWLLWAGIILGNLNSVNCAPLADGWDLVVFSQNWPRSICNTWLEADDQHECNSYPNNTWTIHGVWPTRYGENGPYFCEDKRFRHEAIYGIEEELNRAWSPIIKDKKKYKFWAHEWEKHGSCAATHPRFSTQFDYFYEGLQLYKQYNMNEILKQANISPGQFNNVTRIWNGLKRILNKKPQVICRKNGAGVSLLTEIRLCLNRQLKLVDCNRIKVGEENREERKDRRKVLENFPCRMNTLVHYPSSTRPRYPLTPPTKPPTSNNTNPLLDKFYKLVFS